MSDKETGQSLAPKKAITTIQDHLNGETFKRQIAMVLPQYLTPERFIRVALTAIIRTPKLAECDHHSFFSALMTLSQLGLEPDGRRAHLIPFQNSKRKCTEVQLIVDYKGLVELVMRSGLVSSLHADVVCENDVFDYDCGEIKTHRINFREDRGSVYAVYAIATYKDGSRKCEVMSKDEVEVIRARSRAKDSGPWMTDWREMAKKTCFRRLSKWMSVSPQLRDAIEVDDEPMEDKRFEAAKPVFSAESMKLFNTPGRPVEPLDAKAEPLPAPPAQPPDDEDERAEYSLPPAKAVAEARDEIPNGPKRELSANHVLADILASGGYSYNDLLNALADDGLIDISPWPSIDFLPPATAQRLVKSKAGLLRTLAAWQKGDQQA